MTQQMKVSLNQWLIVAASALFGFWGCYQVLQYRVGEVETEMDKFCLEVKVSSKEEKEKVWARFDKDRLERLDNQNNIKDIKRDVDDINKSLKTQTKINEVIRTDIKTILQKVN